MHIHFDPSASPPSFSLVDPDDFRAFDVVLTQPDADPSALAAMGSVDGDGSHLFVDPDALIELAAERGKDPVWRAELEKMIAFASERGWVDEAGRIRAHIVEA